jgi:hypothetical protein
LLWGRKPFVIARVLGKRGYYPTFDIEEERHLFVSRDERVWSAVVQAPLTEEWEVGEVYSLTPEEIRLFSAVTLSESNPWTNGQLSLCNWLSASLPCDVIGTDLRLPDTRERLEDLLVKTIAEHADDWWVPRQPKGTYTRHSAGSRDEALELLRSVDMEDQLLLAGLSRLLGARRLMIDGHHDEEAALALFTSMGAAFEYLRQVLTPEGEPEATFADVYDYVRGTFPQGDHAVGFFEEMYDLRVTATHPSSRFGDFWCPPMMRGDLYELPKSLMAIYRHIITGTIPPDLP